MRFYDDLNFKKSKKIFMEIVAGEQGLAFSISGILFPFLAFLKLQPIILWKVGHVMA